MVQIVSAEYSDFIEMAPELSQSLLSWWLVSGRKDMAVKPWMYSPDGLWPLEDEWLDPYRICIAEVMLQQTQLQVVLPFWERWMRSFPTLECLAEAREHDVLLLWQGLGYYSRARRLLAGAKQLMGQIFPSLSSTLSAWPKDLDCWMGLPGLSWAIPHDEVMLIDIL